MFFEQANVKKTIFYTIEFLKTNLNIQNEYDLKK